MAESEMRKIPRAEQYARGCFYCLDVIKRRVKVETKDDEKWARHLHCPYTKCPYRELDHYTNYEKESANDKKFRKIMKLFMK